MRFVVASGGRLRGAIVVPGDNSISHRSVMLGALADGCTEVTGFLAGEDTLCTMRAFAAMGVQIDRPEPVRLSIQGVGLRGLRPAQSALDCGNSGTGMRLLCGVLAGQPFDTTLIGDASLSKRPMRRVLAPLRQMGAEIDAEAGDLAPLRVRGGKALHGIEYRSPVASAQVKSSLLLAGLFAEGITTVIEPAATRDHSERMLRAFGATVLSVGNGVSIKPPERLLAQPIVVPSDFSSAAFFLAAAAMTPGSELRLLRVGINSRRTGLLQCLLAMGADIRLENQTHQGGEPVADLHVKGTRLSGIRVPEELVPDMIDEFPMLMVVAACAAGTTVITGAEELRVKESDRLASMAEGLRKLGIQVDESVDGAQIHGGQFEGGVVDSHGDHRIAMSFAMAGFAARGDICITDCRNVNTSFPGFAQLAAGVGLAIQVQD